MTREEREEAKKELSKLIFELGFEDNVDDKIYALNMAIQILSQEPNRDMKEISEIMKCDVDAEIKCKMISNILTAKPHYFKEQEPCDDTVSREAFITRYREWMKSEYGKIPDDDTLTIRVIKSLPSVTPKSIECDDAVSREAILSKIKEVCFSKEWTQFRVNNGSHGQRDFIIDYIEQLSPVTPQTECLKVQAKKQAMPMSCDDCCYEPNSPFCEMYRKNICEKKEEPKSGKWIITYPHGKHNPIYECPRCHASNSSVFKNFCPNCGKKMESEG